MTDSERLREAFEDIYSSWEALARIDPTTTRRDLITALGIAARAVFLSSLPELPDDTDGVNREYAAGYDDHHRETIERWRK